MPGLLLVVGMDAAARDDDDVGAVLDQKIVVNQVMHAAAGDAGGDIHRLLLRAGADANDDSGVVGLGFDFDVLGGLPAGAAAVLADIEGALENAVPFGNDLEKLIGNLVHLRYSSPADLPNGQRVFFSSASSAGRTSSRLPETRTFPSAMTMTWSAISMIRS